MSSRSTVFLLALTVGLIRAYPAEIRIGAIGLDTFHATEFAEIFNNPSGANHVAGGKIVAGFRGGSPDIELSRSRAEVVPKLMAEKFGVTLYDSIEEVARNVDALIIFSVDGRPHLDQFRQVVAAKKPVFIDKPMAGSLRDAVEIVRLARTHETPLFSSSSLRYSPNTPALQQDKLGTIRSVFSSGPAEYEPHHPDLFWYGIHAVEALYRVLGPGCVEVARTQTASTDIVTGIWTGDRVGVLQGSRGYGKGFGVTAYGTKATVSGGDKHTQALLAQQVMTFFQTRVAPVPLDETLEIFAFMEAADESKRRGGARVALADVLRAAGGGEMKAAK